ncbi:MAG: hydrogenase maturation nickel metallochaperone HypA [Archaeoglobaceae archaeon]
MGYAQSLFQHVMRIAEENDAKKIPRIILEVGELLLINPEQLEFCFQTLCDEPVLKDTELEIETSKALVQCITCGKEYDHVTGHCECGGIVSVKGGKDMIIKKVEMEV